MSDNDQPDEESEYVLVDSQGRLVTEVHGEGAESDEDISGEEEVDDEEDEEEDEDSDDLSEEEESDDEDLEPTLEELEDEFKDLRNTVVTLDIKLGIATMGDKKANRQTVYQIKASLASANGQLDDLQFELDGLSLDSKEDKAKRKNLNVEIVALSDKIYDVYEKCEDAVAKLADDEKAIGNDFFKKGKFTEAITHYTIAISIDKDNAIFYTNRALSYQKLDKHDKAIADGKKARSLDVNYLKAYVILTKSYLALGDVDGARETLDAIPFASQEVKDVSELKKLTSAAAKEAGNAFFKKSDKENAIKMYTIAITYQPENHLLYSNRSAAYQSKGSWAEALTDAQKCVQLDETFFKGWLHMGRCQVQLKHWSEVETTVNLAKMLLAHIDGYDKVKPQLDEILTSATAGMQGESAPLKYKTSDRSDDEASNAKKAEQFKERGNAYYKEESYQDAVRFYTQAISLNPSMGSYYGNRAAAWVMLKEYRRGIQDCTDGIGLEKEVGQFDKLRQRKANALAGMGQRGEAITFLQESLKLQRSQNAHVKMLEDQLEKLKKADSWISSANESLEKGEYSRAKRLFLNAQAEGMTDDPTVLLGIAKSCLGLSDYEDASRFSQKAIAACGSSVSTDAYVVRADALQATGCTDLAQKHLTVALQMDPDNSSVQGKLKKLRKTVAETARVRASVDEAMNSRHFELAIARCGEGFHIDREAKKLTAEFHEKRAKAYSMLAKQQMRAPTRAGAAVDASSPAALSRTSWQKCLHDTQSSLYYNSGSDSLNARLLKCEALQALDKHEEAVEELEHCYKYGPGEGDATVREKIKVAKRLLKKSKRVDLYKVLGCTRGELSSEKEIKTCYKKAALKWHPDRHSRAGEEAKKTAEKNFKEIGDAYELLTDPKRKALYDQGYDRDEIEQQMEMQQQQHQQWGRRGGFY